MISKRDIIEISARDQDVALSGLFDILKTLIQKFPSIYDIYKDKNEFLKYLIHDCLFNKEQKG